MTDMKVFERCLLFTGIDENEIKTVLECMSAVSKKYDKGQAVISVGEPIKNVGIVYSGRINIVQEDRNGKANIISIARQGELLGVPFLYANVERSPVNMICTEKSEVVFINYKKIIDNCNNPCVFNKKIIANMLQILGSYTIKFTKKIEYITKNTIREKLFSYLTDQSILNNSNTFTIPFNRQELADYLSVDRSALSSELSKMRDEKILNFEKNEFTLQSLR